LISTNFSEWKFAAACPILQVSLNGSSWPATSRASDPLIASHDAVLFHLYVPDLVALREHLLASAVKVSQMTYPDHMSKDEIRSTTLTVTAYSSDSRARIPRRNPNPAATIPAVRRPVP
jgi:hypothetical protein